MKLWSWMLAAVAAVCGGLPIHSQVQAPPQRPQTARQALIEMLTHGGDAIQKHLTVEVLDLLKSSGNPSSWGTYLSAMKVEPALETFDTGDVLFAYTDEVKKVKYEVHVDNDDLSADEDTLLLSIHSVGDGKELEDTFGLWSSHFTVAMKLQQNIWRLDKITVGLEVPIGDPEFVKKNLLRSASSGLGASAGGFHTPEAHTEIQFDASGNAAQAATPSFPPEQVLSLLSIAEHSFATMDPEIGFTCSLKDLTEMSKRMGVDEQVNTGAYNGYHFALSGCEGTPAGSYQIIAEPLVLQKGAKAFCTDATGNVRVSEDGRGATCLISGKAQQQESEEGGMIGFSVAASESKPVKQK